MYAYAAILQLARRDSSDREAVFLEFVWLVEGREDRSDVWIDSVWSTEELAQARAASMGAANGSAYTRVIKMPLDLAFGNVLLG